MLGCLGKKLGMTQLFLQDGKIVPVTVVQAGPCTVIQKKSIEKDGYSSIQIGFEDKKTKQTSKQLIGHYKKSKSNPKRVLQEFRVNKEELDKYELGQSITADSIFKADDFIDISGNSKGRGFTGVMKRHGFSGGKASHGVHEYHRHGGSIGMSSYPGRVLPGTKMAGRHGNSKTTVLNKKIVKIDKDNNLIFIKGPVPGAPGGFITVRKAVKKKNK